jgi:quinol-cytochrome oxidoreductase complex cytochrome b subunit
MLFILIHWIRGAWIRLIFLNEGMLSLIWVSGWLILSCSMIEGFLGYILNWGQMSYWGITVMINLLSILPLFGLILAELIWCSCNVIITRIFVLHFSLGFLIGSFIFVHLFVLHCFSSSNPLLNSCSSLMIPFFPLFMNDCFVTLIALSLFLSFSCCFRMTSMSTFAFRFKH